MADTFCSSSILSNAVLLSLLSFSVSSFSSHTVLGVRIHRGVICHGSTASFKDSALAE